jgi:cell division protein FtsB
MQGLVSRIAVGVFGLLTIAMILLAIFDDRGALSVREKREKRDQLNQDINSIEKQNEQLKTDIYDLQHNPKAIEKRAREGMKLVKQDEIILLEPETPAQPKEDPSPAPAQ